MSVTLTKETLFRHTPSKTEAKNDVTTKIARSIIEDEIAAREAKSRHLKELRLKKQAEAGNKAPAKIPAPRKAGPKKKLAGKGK